jgi:Fe(3+) dicitrate transport protein
VLQRHGDGFRGLPFDQTDALAKLAVPTSARGEAVLKLGYHRDDAGSDDVGLTRAMYAATPRRDSLSPQSRIQLGRYDVSLIHEERFSPETSLKTLAYAYRTDRDWRRQDYSRVGAPGTPYARVVGEGDPGGTIWFGQGNTVLAREHDVVGVEPRLQHRFTTAGVPHTLDVGGRVLRETAAYEQRSGAYAETYAGALESVERRYGTAFAGYAQDRIAFRDDLLLTPGLRVEHLAMRRVTLRQDTGQSPTDVYLAGESSVTGIVPGVGMIVGQKTAHVFGGLHVGFAPPRVTSAISARGQTSQVEGDKSINYELGTRVTRGPVKAELTGFLSNFQNQVIVSSAASGDAVLADAGATNLVGAESSALVQIGRALRLPTVIDLGARYTYVRSTFRYGPNAGNFLPYAPEHSVSANLDVEHALSVPALGAGALGGQLAWAFTSHQFADAANTVAEDVTGRIGELPARHVVDATAHYRHARSGLSVRLSAKNAFDTTYVISRRPEGIFTGSYRQILLGLRWEWEGRTRD